MKKILFPTEFSDHAPEVFRYAVELAYFFNARLLVMHAFGKPEIRLASEEEKVKKTDVVVDKLIDFVHQHIPEEYSSNLKIDYFAYNNYPAEAILKLALDESADLIVIGTTGKKNPMETLLGSTSLEVIAKADCPVLAVPSGAKFEGIDNLVYTTNFEFRDLAAINYLKKWSKTFDAPIHCLHVVEDEQKMERLLKNMAILRETFRKHKRIRFAVVQGNFQSEINRFAKGKRADIIAMMAHKRSMISRLVESSAVDGAVRKIHIPLLIIKDNAFELDSDLAGWIQIANSIA